MVDSTRLVDQLVAAEDEIKRLKRELDDAKAHIHALEVDASGLRGSCKAMGAELTQLRRANKSMARGLVWFSSNATFNPVAVPSWLARSCARLLKRGDTA